MSATSATSAPIDVVLGKLDGVKRVSRGWVALCPAHPDRNPSLGIDEKPDGSLLLRCRSTGCRASDIVAKLGLTLADLYPAGSVRPDGRATEQRTTVTDADLAALNDYLISSTRRLANASAALAELQHRFGLNPDDASALGLGYDDGSTAISRPSFLSRAWEGPARLVIPMRDRDGVARGVQGRALGLVKDDGRKKRWLGASGIGWSQVACFYNPMTLILDDEAPVIVCEGLSDPLAVAGVNRDALGVRGATLAACAVGEIVEAVRGRSVVVFGDADRAGSKFARQVADGLVVAGISTRIAAVPAEYGDLAEWAAAVGVEQFETALEQAVRLSEPVEEASTAETAAFDDYTDLGNARLLVAERGDQFRYVKRFGEFLIWAGTHWAEDQTGEIERLAKATVDGLLPRIPVEPDGEKRKKLTTHYARSRDDRKLTAMVKVARTEPGIAVLADQLDRDQWLLNVSNGTVDLRTGQIHLHDPDELHTKVAPVDFLSDAACPTWLRFLDDIFLSDAALIEFVQRAVGYSLTGSVSEQVLFFLYGGGSNGKTTFTRAIGDLLGTSNGYAKTIDPSLLMRTNHEQHPTGLTDLRGTRFAITSETGEGKRLDEELIKRLTGGDKITARRMRQDFFEFEPTHKIWLYGNHRPSIQGTDFAIWRRLLLVPFDREFSELEKDGDMAERLAAERSGILTWAVEGCLAWQTARSLGVPDRVRASTQQYRSSEDHVGRFLEDCCTIRPGLEITASDLRAVYVAWAQEQGERPWSEHKLAPRFEERGFKKERTGHHNSRTWFGFTANGVDSQLGLATVKPPSDEEPF